MATSKMIESIPCTELKGITHIDVEVYYTKGGSKRGYYISVKPVTRDEIMVSYIMFTGIVKLLLETSRFSAKQFEQAVQMGRDAAPELVKQVIEQEKAA